MRTHRHLAWLLASLLGSAGCAALDGEDAFSPWDEDESDTTTGDGPGGKADAIAGYRAGCNEPIRTGRYVLKGDVVTPTGVVKGGFVVVEDEKIVEVRTRTQGPGQGVTAVDTGGIIFPGLIDGHNHVEYNVVPLADLGQRFANRNQWPRKAAYKRLIKDPRKAVITAGLTCQGVKHGEVRALVGGTTSIQGAPYSPCVRPLVRNIEQTNFCRDKVRTNVLGAASYGKGDPSFAEEILDDLAQDKLDAYVLHLGEGIDASSQGEFSIVKNLELNRPEMIMVHGTAFTDVEFREAGAVGAKLVWSPLSNLLLYGKTTDVPAAVRNGVLVSLGSDWAPSGSANVLGELKIADKVNKVLWAGEITDEELIAMVTLNPAIAYGADKELGSIEAGKYADLMVVARKTGVSAYRALIDARPQDVLLTTISGDPLYGTVPLMEALGKAGDHEKIDACGAPRAVDATVVAADVPGAEETLDSIESRLKAVIPQLTPIFECDDAAARKAYQGTELEGK